MSVALLPSEVARLILNYLKEQELERTYDTFLDECKYLDECRSYFKRGLAIPKTIHGKTLEEYLVINPEKLCFPSVTSTSTQTDDNGSDVFKSPDMVITRNHESTQPYTNSSDIELIDTAKNLISLSNSKPLHVDDEQINLGTPTRSKRLLIGKQTEKVPELSNSTLVRQLVSIVNDAADQMKKEEEQEEELKKRNALDQQFMFDVCQQDVVTNVQHDQQQVQQPQTLDYAPVQTSSELPKPQQPIFYELINNGSTFVPSQQVPIVLSPLPIKTDLNNSNLNVKKPKQITPIRPSNAKYSPIAKAGTSPIGLLKNSKPILTEIIKLTPIESKPSSSAVATTLFPTSTSSASSTSTSSSFSKPTTKMPRREYNRVTPTIKQIYEKTPEEVEAVISIQPTKGKRGRRHLPKPEASTSCKKTKVANSKRSSDSCAGMLNMFDLNQMDSVKSSCDEQTTMNPSLARTDAVEQNCKEIRSKDDDKTSENDEEAKLRELLFNDDINATSGCETDENAYNFWFNDNKQLSDRTRTLRSRNNSHVSSLK